MKVLQLFPSKYLKAADLGDRPHDVTISEVKVGMVGEGQGEEERPIMCFEEFGKWLVLNVTNTKRIISLYGDDSDGWIGQRITIYPSECDYKGDTVACIRVKPNAPVTRKPAKASAKTVPAKKK